MILRSIAMWAQEQKQEPAKERQEERERERERERDFYECMSQRRLPGGLVKLSDLAQPHFKVLPYPLTHTHMHTYTQTHTNTHTHNMLTLQLLFKLPL